MDQRSVAVAANISTRFGIPLAAVVLIATALYDTGHAPGWVQVIEFILVLGSSFFAGRTAARRTRRVRDGATAGGITSAFAAVVFLGANIVMAAVTPTQFARAFGYHDMNAGALMIAAVTQSLIGLILWALFGLLLGAAGGLLRGNQPVQAPVDVPTHLGR